MLKKTIARFVRKSSAIFCEELSKRCLDSKKVNHDFHDTIVLNLLRNRHLGHRCFVIGNGPSLTLEDLNKLRFEYTFASNKIFLVFDETEWRPTYFSCEDPLVMQQNGAVISSLKRTTKIFPKHMLQYMKREPCSYFIKFIPAPTILNPKRSLTDRDFSYDLTEGIHWGSTITYSLIQQAVFMGFKEIYLLGIDHSYTVPDKKVNGCYVCEGEVNHFHKNYRVKGEKWNEPRADVLEVSYKYAKKACEAVGVSIFNASRKTKLDVFEKVHLDDVLKNRE